MAARGARRPRSCSSAFAAELDLGRAPSRDAGSALLASEALDRSSSARRCDGGGSSAKTCDEALQKRGVRLDAARGRPARRRPGAGSGSPDGRGEQRSDTTVTARRPKRAGSSSRSRAAAAATRRRRPQAPTRRCDSRSLSDPTSPRARRSTTVRALRSAVRQALGGVASALDLAPARIPSQGRHTACHQCSPRMRHWQLAQPAGPVAVRAAGSSSGCSERSTSRGSTAPPTRSTSSRRDEVVTRLRLLPAFASRSAEERWRQACRRPRRRPPRVRTPPEVTVKRAWRPSPIGLHVGDAGGGHEQVHARVAHPERPQSARAPRPARSPTASPGDDRVHVLDRHEVLGSSAAARRARPAPPEGIEAGRLDLEPRRHPVAAEARQVLGARREPGVQVVGADAARPTRGRGRSVQRDQHARAGDSARPGARRRSRSRPDASPRPRARGADRRASSASRGAARSASNRIARLDRLALGVDRVELARDLRARGRRPRSASARARRRRGRAARRH